MSATWPSKTKARFNRNCQCLLPESSQRDFLLLHCSSVWPSLTQSWWCAHHGGHDILADLISLGPNRVPGLFEVAVSTGTPTIHASSLSVSCIIKLWTCHHEMWACVTFKLDIGSLINDAIPAGRGRSFWCTGLLKLLKHEDFKYKINTLHSPCLSDTLSN